MVDARTVLPAPSAKSVSPNLACKNEMHTNSIEPQEGVIFLQPLLEYLTLQEPGSRVGMSNLGRGLMVTVDIHWSQPSVEFLSCHIINKTRPSYTSLFHQNHGSTTAETLLDL